MNDLSTNPYWLLGRISVLLERGINNFQQLKSCELRDEGLGLLYDALALAGNDLEGGAQ